MGKCARKAVVFIGKGISMKLSRYPLQLAEAVPLREQLKTSSPSQIFGLFFSFFIIA